jgi:serine/threonine protein phosphatase PrpC
MTSTPLRVSDDSLNVQFGRWRNTRWISSAFSLQGTGHSVNQDSFHCRPGHFWGVADGVGGGAHGEVASQMLLASMAALTAPMPEEIKTALQAADGHIDAHIRALGKGMGAAVMACAWTVSPDHCLAVVVGDCRVLHLRHTSGIWQSLWSSPDQSYAYQGLQPPPGVSLQAPANMVGCGMSADALMHKIQLGNKDRLVMCSDGFSSQLSKPVVSGLLELEAWPLRPEAAKMWCQGARGAGSQDDVTVLIVERQDQFTSLAWAVMVMAATLCVAALLAWGRWA